VKSWHAAQAGAEGEGFERFKIEIAEDFDRAGNVRLRDPAETVGDRLIGACGEGAEI